MIYLYRIYQLLIAAPLLLVLTVVCALITSLGCYLGLGRWFGYWPAHFWARCFCWLSLVRVTVRGRENIDPETSYVFVANHQGAYDIFSIFGFLNHNFRWMMKKSLRNIPLVGFSCMMAGHIFVDNSTPSATRKTMRDAERQLSGGMSVVVFPEGSRTPDGHLKRFKRGAFALAMEFGLPVVPVTIDGAYDVLPRFGRRIPNYGHIILTIHAPIHAGADGHCLEDLMAQSHAAIASALPEANR